MARHRRRRAYRLAAAVVAVLAALAALAVVLTVADDDPQPSVTASSTASGYDPADLLTADGPEAVWRSDGATTGVAVTVHFVQPTTVSRLTLRSVEGPDRIAQAHLEFSDGSALLVVPSQAESRLPFGARTVTSVTLVVDAAVDGAAAVELAGLRYDDADPGVGGGIGDLAPAAAVTASSTGGGDPQALASGRVGPDSVWSAAADDPEPWLELRWSEPQELTSVRLFGSAEESGSVRASELRFSDGSVVPMAGVLADRATPTTVAFLPRVVTTVRLVAREPAVSLRAVQAHGRGGGPAAVEPGEAPAATVEAPPAACDPGLVSAEAPSELELVCPVTGSTVSGEFDIGVSTAAGAALTVTAWVPGNDSATGSVEVVGTATADGDGRAHMTVDGAELPEGPLNLRVSEDDGDELWVQVVNASGVALAADPPASGMTLAYADDFAGPLSLSATGRRTTYTATKPGESGPSEFGSAIFADPEQDPDNVGTIGGYLRLRTSPLPEGRADPYGWERTALGAMVSSATLGGGGFSAQYGYFEARVLGAPGMGTWPAFWMVSTPNIGGSPRTAEIDAFELYGHATGRACHATHNWDDGVDRDPTTTCRDLPSGGDWALQWHTYGVRVLPQHVVFYVDGIEVERAPRGPAADEPLYFMLNLALGGGQPIDLSATGEVADMYVDWVRVYT